jgi:hypothetical protein
MEVSLGTCNSICIIEGFASLSLSSNYSSRALPSLACEWFSINNDNVLGFFTDEAWFPKTWFSNSQNMKIWKKPQELKSNVNYKIHYKFNNKKC